jgi:LuxR family maltose regulon positive regulatory protein
VSKVSLPSDALVSTKLRPSRARPNLVARPRLTAALEREPGRKLTLISAPAGFGKTTLLLEWFEDRGGGGGSVAWLSLDEGDNDPVRFLSYLVASLGKSVGEGFGEGVLAALRSPEPPRMEAVLGALVNELASLPGEVGVILDDYHLIDSENVHGMVSFLLERLPEGAQLVVSGRVDPPLPLARVRARGQMSELHAADLRFTPEEAAAFLGEAMGLDLSADDVAALDGITEGWIAALQLAALSMRGREDASGFVRSFSGGHRDVFDFLAEEVLQRQTEEVQTFLLETSILERFSGPMCDALTGRSDGQEMLEKLERENLFVVPLDDERRWYRYHHLFADFLHARLQHEDPERVEEMHRAVAAWCEHHGLIDAAVRHALAAGDPEWAARLIEQHVTGLVARNERATLERWFAALPVEVIRSRPRLCLARAYRAMVGGRLDELEQLLEDAERALDAPDSGAEEQVVASSAESGGATALFFDDLPASVANLRSALAYLRGDADGVVEFARLAKARVPAGHFLSDVADWNLARARWMRGELDEAEQDMRVQVNEAARRAAEEPYRALAVSWTLGRVQSARGRLSAALRTYRDALKLSTVVGDSAKSVLGFAHVGLAEVMYEQNVLDAALEHADEGVERCRSLADRMPLAAGLATLAIIRQALGDPTGALRAIGEAEKVGLSPKMTDLFNPVPAQRARLLLAQGDVAEAVEWAAERGLGVDDEPSYLREREHLVLARVLLAEDKPEQAMRLLGRLRENAQAAQRIGSEIAILSLEAMAMQAKGEKENAASTLAHALILAEPEGYVRTFVDEGPPMTKLLSGLLEDNQRGRLDSLRRVPAHYLRKLLAALERDATGTARPATGLPEALSERELEVLQLIAAGKSNRRIASELFISVGTVKTHINHLYRKLDAHSRTQALARARELGLV